MTPVTSRSHLAALDIATWGGFIVFAIVAVIAGINLPEISATFQMNLAAGGALETARNAIIFIVLLVAGLLAQRWGKRRFLALGHYTMAAGLLLISFAQDYPTLLFSTMLLGVGGGFSEALLTPLIVDIHPRESGKYLNLSHAFFPLGIVLAALTFGELLTRGYSWRLSFQLAAALALTIAILFTILRLPPSEHETESYFGQFRAILRMGLFWLFAAAIMLGAAVESALTFWSRTYVETYLSEVPRVGAIAIVVFAGAMMIGRFVTAWLANRFNLNTIMVGSAVLGIVVSVVIPFATSLSTFYGLLALAGLATACLWPTLLAEADDSMEVNTTTLFIALASVGIIGFGVTPWLMGIIGDLTNLRVGFFIVPVLFGVLTAVLLFERQLSSAD
jgi:fucose permease